MQDQLSRKSFEELQRRVRARVAELNEAPSALAVRHGLGKDFIRDIIDDKPRKRAVSARGLSRLAAALDVDEEYLTLRQPTPRRTDNAATEGTRTGRGKVRFGGRTKVGRWDAAPVETDIPLLPTVAAPGLNVDTAYVHEDETLAGLGIHAGMVLYAELAGKSKTGDVVIIRRTIGPLVELSARVKGDDGLYELRPQPGLTPIAEPARSTYKEAEVAVVRVVQMLLA